MKYIEIMGLDGYRYRFYRNGAWRSKADWLPWEKIPRDCVTG